MLKKPYLTLLLILLTSVSVAQSPEEKGLAIVQEADSRDQGWVDLNSNVKLTLRNRHGEESFRQSRNKTLEVKNDGDKSLIVFDSPRDIKGTAFLSVTHALKPDDQWIFLPELKRVKRISSRNKSGPFLGSEFAYEDISSQEVDKYSYNYLRDEIIDEQDTYVIEQFPQYKHTGYSKIIMWLDKIKFQPLKLEFYDRKKSLLKTLSFHEYKQYLNKFWRSSRMEMVNHQSGKSTTLAITDLKFNTGLKTSDFTKTSLKRAR